MFFFTTEYCILCGISFTPVQQKCQYRHKIHNGWTTNVQKVPRGKIYLKSIFQHTKMSFSTFTTIKQQQSSSSLPSSNSNSNNNNTNNNINHHHHHHHCFGRHGSALSEYHSIVQGGDAGDTSCWADKKCQPITIH